ncbi:HutD/Ves family protein [Achromobacter kerstersii]
MRAVHANWQDLPPEPWKNGGGVTRTLAVDDAASARMMPPRWRVSVADITRDGAYSRFPGVDRVSVVLSGAGVALRGDGVDIALLPGRAVAFAGDVALQSHLLEGAVRVLNLFVLRGAVQAQVCCGGAQPVTVKAGSLEDAAGPASHVRIVVDAQNFYIDSSCQDDAVSADALPPDVVRIDLHMAALGAV